MLFSFREIGQLFGTSRTNIYLLFQNNRFRATIMKCPHCKKRFGKFMVSDTELAKLREFLKKRGRKATYMGELLKQKKEAGKNGHNAGEADQGKTDSGTRNP